MLTDQLVKPLAGDHASALGVDIHAVIGAGRGAVQRHPEAHRLAAAGRSQHQVQVTALEVVDDLAAGGVERCELRADGPGADQAPVVDGRRRGQRIDFRLATVAVICNTLMWTFVYKLDTDGYLAKYKARLCIRGDLQEPTYLDTYVTTLAARIF